MRDRMRALTIWPEWIWSIIHLGKDVENRTYAPPRVIRGQRIALHSGVSIGGKYRKFSKHAAFFVDLMRSKAKEAGIESRYAPLGGLSIPDRILWSNPSIPPLVFSELTKGAVAATAVIEDRVHLYHAGQEAISPWAAVTQYQWILRDIQVLDHPVPCTGRQGLWPLDPREERMVLQQCD